MNYRNRKRCDTCKKGNEMCIFMEQAKNARTTAQKKAHEIMCAKCPCYGKEGQCFRSTKSGCANHIEK